MQYLMPAARNTKTRQLVKRQELSSRRYLVQDSEEVWALSQALAEDLSARSRQSWVAEPITYTGN